MSHAKCQSGQIGLTVVPHAGAVLGLDNDKFSNRRLVVVQSVLCWMKHSLVTLNHVMLIAN